MSVMKIVNILSVTQFGSVKSNNFICIALLFVCFLFSHKNYVLNVRKI